MTNQKMVMSEGKSGIQLALAMPDSSVFPPNGHLSLKKKLRNRRRINATTSNSNSKGLLRSMRASSPTRTPAQHHASNWILQHPSALNMLEEIVGASKGKQIVVFLDYDGTLSPIVQDPDRAFITSDMRQAVSDVAKFFPTAIVTGRSRAKVYDFVRLSELYYAGSHGMDIEGPTKPHTQTKGNQTVLCQPASEFLPIIDEVYRAMIEKVNNIPGAKVEKNRFCLSVHYRCVDEKKWIELADRVKTVIKDYSQLRLTHGRKVFEIRPTIKWDKGNAVEFLLESLGYAESNDVLPIYIGDDRTDEDAFRVLRERGQGLGILVSKSPKETNASYSLQGPTEVMHFLRRLVEWKKLSLLRHYS